MNSRSRLFRTRRHAFSLFHKLTDDESGKYLPLDFAKVEQLRAWNPEWVMLDEEMES